MAKDISDMFNLNITMYDDFETSVPEFNPMQGRKDTNMIVRLSKDGELINVDNPCGITVKFLIYASENDRYRIKAVSTSNTALNADARTLTNGVIMPSYKVTIHN